MIIAGVALTVIVVIAVGIAVARKTDGDSDNYLVAGRTLGLPLVAVSLTAAAVDSNATVGNTDLTAEFGFWAGASLAIGLAICLLLAGLFIAKPMNAMRLYTLGDFYRIRYNRQTELVAAVVMTLAYTFLLAGNLVACGYLLEYFAHIPYAIGLTIAAVLVLGYTIAGGLFSDAYTSLIQTVITVIASIAMLVWVMLTYGIVIPEGMGPFDLGQLTDPAQGAPINWATLVALGVGDLVAIDFMQRIFGAKSPETAQKACFVGAGITAFVGTVFALTALTATAVLGLSPESGPILYQLLGEYAPPMMAILVLSGVVAASFSTASGAILATSGLIVRNVFQVRRSVITGKQDPLLRWTRTAMVPITLVGVLVAIRVSETGILLTLAFDLMLACLAPAMLIGLFWKRPGVAAALSAAAVGLVMRLGFLVLIPTLYGVENTLLYIPNPFLGAGMDGWATLLTAAMSAATYVLVSLARPRTTDEALAEELELAALADERSDAPLEPALV